MANYLQSLNMVSHSVSEKNHLSPFTGNLEKEDNQF